MGKAGWPQPPHPVSLCPLAGLWTKNHPHLGERGGDRTREADAGVTPGARIEPGAPLTPTLRPGLPARPCCVAELPPSCGRFLQPCSGPHFLFSSPTNFAPSAFMGQVEWEEAGQLQDHAARITGAALGLCGASPAGSSVSRLEEGPGDRDPSWSPCPGDAGPEGPLRRAGPAPCLLRLPGGAGSRVRGLAGGTQAVLMLAGRGLCPTFPWLWPASSDSMALSTTPLPFIHSFSATYIFLNALLPPCQTELVTPRPDCDPGRVPGAGSS